MAQIEDIIQYLKLLEPHLDVIIDNDRANSMDMASSFEQFKASVEDYAMKSRTG